MVDFYVYDIGFLILFSLWVVWFLYKRRKNLKREMGIAFLYRTQFGVRFIDRFSEKYSKLLHALKYVVISSGVVLMVGIVWLISKSFYTYAKFPEITKIVKAPPIAPLIPYFPKLFGMESFFPPLYFTYFIVALAIVAIVHEFSHGIFMRLFKIKIKSTGFVFLGPILGAFVEQDQEDMKKKKKSEQMTVLAAGTFANLIFAFIFWLLLIGFFYVSLSPAGAQFTSYSQAILPIASITGFENLSESLTKVYVGNKTYLLDEELKIQLEPEKNASLILAYHNAPAVKENLEGIIIQIDDEIIKNKEDLADYLETKKPNEEIKIITNIDGEEKEYGIILGEHPLDKGKGYIGVGFAPDKGVGVVGGFISLFMGFKKPSTYYEPRWDGEFVEFIYNLLWWIMIINLLIALFNMMPLGILDGGQFFYLGILSLTGNKNFAKILFKIFTYAILFLFLLIMMFWMVRVF
tara:strand:- start:1001 stop:2389 length:1389 start_codon:yes stop_codon:yes gene_type:complete